MSKVSVKIIFSAQISAKCLAQEGFSINVYEINEQNHAKL